MRMTAQERRNKNGGPVLNKAGEDKDSAGRTRDLAQDALSSGKEQDAALVQFTELNLQPDSAGDGRQFALIIQAIARDQDRTAFRQLFAHFAPRIRTMLRRSGCTSEAAEDLAQECMLAVWRKAGYFDPSRAAASTWIYAIARNLRIDVARRERRAKLHAIAETWQPAPESPTQPDELTDELDRQERVQAALKHLPPEQLQVVMASFVEGKAHSQISTELGIPIGTVKSRMRLAMGRLRPVLEDLQ